ncbi:unnamed protein product [Paramecium sonneborni]|uniref:Uncharacterized protein n=1 Tax=Paramecium sonneborni TaxID=65129 RepID=A0A8S1LQM9_9CILI|nr:unnamed protein product [Paramecium sonneborni]
MIDRKSQSPIATNYNMGTVNTIFDTGKEQEPTKRLTRSIKNTSTDPQQKDYMQFQNQPLLGVQGSQEMNSQNPHQFTQENFEYRKPQTDSLNFRTVQTYKPEEVSALPTSQFNYQSFEYKKPDAGRTGSYIQSAYNTTFQEPIGSSLNFQNKTLYEPLKQDNTFTKYEFNTFDKYKTTYEQPKTYEKFDHYKFEPIKQEYNLYDKPNDYQLSYKSIPQIQPNSSVVQTQYTPYYPDRITLDTQQNKTTLNPPPLAFESLSIGPKATDDLIRTSEIQVKTQNPIEPLMNKVQKPPSVHAESVKKEQIYRPTTPIYTQQQYQLSNQIQPESQFKQEPIDIFNKPSYRSGLPQKHEEIVIIENEANEHEFQASCQIF